MEKLRKLRAVLGELESKYGELDDMSKAWDSDDPCAQACSDPSDQFLLSEEIDRLWEDLRIEASK